MLDVPIWLNGEDIGIICHEHINSQREWSLDEKDFAASMADFVSLTLDSIQRRKAEEALRKANAELEIRVLERTAELAQANEKLAFFALHDGLTHLPNRFRFEERFKQILEQCRPSGEKFGLMFIDLDHFKKINDHWVHIAGDAVLKEVAFRLQSCTPKRYRRPESAEMSLFSSHTNQGRDDIQLLRDRIQRALRDPIHFQGTPHQVTLSIGAAIYPDDGEETKSLLTRADLALYEAKTAGGGTLQFFRHSSP
jgi:diguanylate cyclase (GGDEF)-like protein